MAIINMGGINAGGRGSASMSLDVRPPAAEGRGGQRQGRSTGHHPEAGGGGAACWQGLHAAGAGQEARGGSDGGMDCALFGTP